MKIIQTKIYSSKKFALYCIYSIVTCKFEVIFTRIIIDVFLFSNSRPVQLYVYVIERMKSVWKSEEFLYHDRIKRSNEVCDDE